MNRIAKSGVFALVTVAFVLISLSTAFADDLQPKIVIPTMRMDFGKVYERDLFEHHFVVRNQGKADLVIESVKPG